jgi:hypothetical protein
LSPLRDRTAKIRLSLYADDAAVFINPVREEVDLLMGIMRKFGDATDLRINMSKSTVVPIRCSVVNLDEVLQNFSGDRAALPITYLGLPITVNKVKMGHLQPVLDHAYMKLSGWQVELLNIGGRRELVKTGSVVPFDLPPNSYKATKMVLQRGQQTAKEVSLGR